MMRLPKTHKFSFYALLAIAAYLIYTAISVEAWKEKKIISADRANYYVYLPATFIYSDLHFEYVDSLNEELGGRYATYFKNEDGRKCQKMTAGVAIMELPFFLVAHLWASIDEGYQANGYEEIYYIFILISSLFYALLSLYFIRKILLHYARDEVVAFVLILFGTGTNLMYYSTYTGGMAHLPGLFLISCFIWYSIQWIETKSIKAISISALSLGMAAVIRPSNIIFILFLPAFIQESGWGFGNFIKYKLSHIRKVILPALLFMLPVLIQMVLWKYISGHWIQYSYGDEGFFFTKPKIINGLLSARNGMLPYAPFLIFAFFGMLLPLKKNTPKFSLLIPFCVFIYLIYSWWSWWYGGSVGSRAAIESYAILALFLAYFFEFVWHKAGKKAALIFIIPLAAFSLYFMSLKSDQYRRTILHWDSMTYANYWDVFLTSKRSAGYNDKLQIPDYKNAKSSGEEYLGFKEMTIEEPLSDGINIELKEIDWNVRDSISIKAFIFGENKFKKEVVKLKISSAEGQFSKEYKIIPDKKRRQWNEATMTIYIPENIRDKSIDVAYIYSGTSRCYYKLPELIITNSLPDLKN